MMDYRIEHKYGDVLGFISDCVDAPQAKRISATAMGMKVSEIRAIKTELHDCNGGPHDLEPMKFRRYQE